MKLGLVWEREASSDVYSQVRDILCPAVKLFEMKNISSPSILDFSSEGGGLNVISKILDDAIELFVRGHS